MSNGPLRFFLCSLPGWFVVFKTIELSLLRSKEPEWFDLYSTKKLLVLIGGLITAAIWLKLVTPRLASLRQWPKISKRMQLLRPAPTFVTLAILFRLATLGLPASVGEDTAPQILSSLQWLEGNSPGPNFIETPAINDLSVNNTEWILRPIAIAWLPLPGLLCGLSLGHALHLGLFALSITGGLGWLALARRFSLPDNLRQIAALVLALAASTEILSLSTASCITAATFPWLLVWAGKLSSRLVTEKPFTPRNLLETPFFYLTLGTLAWVKLSSLLTITGAGAALLLFCLFNQSIGKRLRLGILFAASGILFFLPYIALEQTNIFLAGTNADEMYTTQDYNAQASLWGEHFTESTQGAMLALSLAAAPGYALPAKSIAHGFRDLLSQFADIRDWFAERKINREIFLVAVASLGLTICMAMLILQLSPECTPFEKAAYWALFTTPFAVLALVSRLHGYNYVLYHSYTGEFAFIFSLACLRVIASNQRRTFPTSLLVAICLAFPLCLSAERLTVTILSPRKSTLASAVETSRDLGESRFSQAIQVAEKDARSDLDVVFFLPSGNKGDLRLRTSLRSMAIHFSKDNLAKYGPFRTTHTLRVYCLIDAGLKHDSDFLSVLKNRFPKASTWRNLSPQKPDAAGIWRVELPPPS